jgi:hypothetical protein
LAHGPKLALRVALRRTGAHRYRAATGTEHAIGAVYPPFPGGHKRETLGAVTIVSFDRPIDSRRAAIAPRVALAFIALCLAPASGLWSCRTATSNERHWRHCSCTYVSDFDDQSGADIEVCSDDRHAEEVATICIRNDGVGVPSGCHCNARPIGPCANSERCRVATVAPR